MVVYITMINGWLLIAERRAQLQKSRSRANVGPEANSREIDGSNYASSDTPRRPERRKKRPSKYQLLQSLLAWTREVGLYYPPCFNNYYTNHIFSYYLFEHMIQREDNLHCSSTTYVLNSLLPAVQTSSCRLLNKCSKVLNITRQCLTWKFAWNLCTINIWVYMGHIILISQLTVWCPRSLRQMNVQVMIFSTDSKLCENKTTSAALRMIGGAVTYWSLLPHCLQLPCLVFSMWETRLAKLHTGDQARQTCLSKHEMNTCNLRSIHS